jgi:hypothetical protein
MANLTPEVEDRLLKLDRYCETLGKEDSSVETYLKNFRSLIVDLIRNPEKYSTEEFKKRCAFVRDVVVSFRFGPSKDAAQKKKDR